MSLPREMDTGDVLSSATAREVWATEVPVGPDDPPLFHGLDELEQAPATLRPGDRLPFPVLQGPFLTAEQMWWQPRSLGLEQYALSLDGTWCAGE